MRPQDGAPSGELRVTTGSDALTVEFRPFDGRPYAGAYLIGLDGESWTIVSDGGSVSVPWDGLADDVCGCSVTAGIASLPDQNLIFAVRCADGAPTEAATSTGGSSGGGSCQP